MYLEKFQVRLVGGLRNSLFVDPGETVDSTEKQTAGIGAFPVSVVRELGDIEIGLLVVMEEIVLRVILGEALIGTQPKATVGSKKDAVNHVVGDTAVLVELAGAHFPFLELDAG